MPNQIIQKRRIKMSSKLDYVKSQINDVYFGRAERANIGGVEFNRFGFAYAGTVRNCKYDAIDVNEHDGIIWVEFVTIGEPVIVVGIPKRAIQIPEN